MRCSEVAGLKSTYHLTLFHELIHATGHVSRLNRKGVMEKGVFGEKEYSLERVLNFQLKRE